MIPRGEVGLVFAGVGAASGVLSKPLGAAIIMMVIITTFIAPPLLRFVFPESNTAANLDSNSGQSSVIKTPESLTSTKED
jgi:Kef-type K+ transport system membrane component KefB